MLTERELVTATLMRTAVKRFPLMPHAGRYVVHPSFLCGGKVEHPERVSLVLIGVADSVINPCITLPGKFDRMGADSGRPVTLRPPCDAGAALIAANPKDA